MLGGGGSAPTTRIAAPGSGGSGSTAQQACATDAASRAACNAFSSADNTWEAIFARAGERFQVPKLVFYAGNGPSGCGAAQSAMGPFYCPSDQGIHRSEERRVGKACVSTV